MNLFSLNQLRIGLIPEAGLEELQDKTGWELFSVHAVRKAVMTRKAELSPYLSAYPSRDCSRALSDALGEENPAARELTEQLGRRLGLLFYSLTAAQEQTRARNPSYESNSDAWAFWSGVTEVQLSGGLASGAFGKLACEQATAFLRRCGVENLTVLPDFQGFAAPLIGCARGLEDSPEHALVFDFGQSFLKGGVAAYEADKLVKLSTLPNVPAKFQKRDYLTAGLRRWGAKRLHNYLLEQITCCWNRYKGTPGLSCHIAISLAANFSEDGRIINAGGYGKLWEVSPDYADVLGDALSDAIGRKMTVHLIHDGQAGANAYDPAPGKVVVTCGTAFAVAQPQPVRHACGPYLIVKEKS